ncbi:unnamed protein product [Brassica rapa subsp. trilocularis]
MTTEITSLRNQRPKISCRPSVFFFHDFVVLWKIVADKCFP